MDFMAIGEDEEGTIDDGVTNSTNRRRTNSTNQKSGWPHTVCMGKTLIPGVTLGGSISSGRAKIKTKVIKQCLKS
jgi:hypothetical protein